VTVVTLPPIVELTPANILNSHTPASIVTLFNTVSYNQAEPRTVLLATEIVLVCSAVTTGILDNVNIGVSLSVDTAVIVGEAL
jgi:hypothetical protein